MKNFKFYSLVLALFLSGINLTFGQNLTVITMPSWTNNHNEGNAIVNQPITVWGAMLGDNIANYQAMLCVDNVVVTTTPVATNGSYINNHYIEYSYTPTTTGCKLVTLKILTAPNDTLKSESYIRVFSPNDPGIDSIKVNMMIDKGLLFLFKNAMLISANNVQWTSNGNGSGFNVNAAMNTYSATCAAILAFEEQRHLCVDALQTDPYAQVVQYGVNNILLSAGSNCLLSNNGSWSEYTTCTYVNGIGLSAIIMAMPNASVAKTQVNSIVNKSYYTFDSLAIQSIYNNQGGTGCWHYQLDASDDHNYDGSAQQWPEMIFLAAQQRYNMPLVFNSSYVVSGVNCYLSNICSTGATPYGDCSLTWYNVGITGGMLSAFATVNKYYTSDADALNSMTFIMNNFDAKGYENGWSSHTSIGWPGSLYHMYGLKRGLYMQQNNTLKPFTINGTTIDWYGNLASWLSGEQVFALDPTLKTNNSGMLLATNSYGQNSDGSWYDNCFFNDGSNYFSTAMAILILSRNLFQQQTIVTPIPVSMCVGDSVQLIASPGRDYVWTPTSNLNNPNIQKPWANPDTTTTYYVTCIDEANCPVLDTAYTVSVVNTLNISFQPDTFSLCPPNTILLKPDFGTSGAVNCVWSPPLYLSSTTGETVICQPTSDSLTSITYTVTGTAGTSCTGQAYVTVNINPIPVIAVSATPQSMCKGDSAKITFNVIKGNEPFLYKWNNDSISTVNTVSSIYVTPTVTTTYTVTVTDETSCGSIKTIAIIVKPLPKPLIVGDTTTCTGAQRVLYTTDANMSNYIWAVSGGHITTNNGNLILVFWNTSGQDTVTVTYTAADGCTGTTSYPVTVNITPATPTITLGVENEIVSNSGTGNQWYNLNGPMTGETSSTYTPIWGGTYYVIVTENGCASLPSNEITIAGIGVHSNPNNLIKIYPNPAKDVINIELLSDNNNFKNLLISLYDVEGKELLNTNFNNLQTKQISTKPFSKGVYYLKIYNDNFVVFNKILII